MNLNSTAGRALIDAGSILEVGIDSGGDYFTAPFVPSAGVAASTIEGAIVELAGDIDAKPDSAALVQYLFAGDSAGTPSQATPTSPSLVPCATVCEFRGSTGRRFHGASGVWTEYGSNLKKWTQANYPQAAWNIASYDPTQCIDLWDTDTAGTPTGMRTCAYEAGQIDKSIYFDTDVTIVAWSVALVDAINLTPGTRGCDFALTIDEGVSQAATVSIPNPSAPGAQGDRATSAVSISVPIGTAVSIQPKAGSYQNNDNVTPVAGVGVCNNGMPVMVLSIEYVEA